MSCRLVEATNTKPSSCINSTHVIGQNINNLQSFESLKGNLTSTSPTHFELCSPAFPRTQPPSCGCKRLSGEVNGQNGTTVCPIKPTTLTGATCGVKASGQCQVCSGFSTDSSGCGHPSPSSPDQDMVNSFNSLCVNGVRSQLFPPFSSPASHRPRTCRQQQADYDNYGSQCFDDTTVDDLAGYLDELMHLPKPMSEMAELMYT